MKLLELAVMKTYGDNWELWRKEHPRALAILEAQVKRADKREVKRIAKENGIALPK